MRTEATLERRFVSGYSWAAAVPCVLCECLLADRCLCSGAGMHGLGLGHVAERAVADAEGSGATPRDAQHSGPVEFQVLG